MKKLLFLFLIFFNSPNLLSEIYTEHYGEVEISSTFFSKDIPNDNRKNYLNSVRLEYNYFFENNNLSGKIKIDAKESDPNSSSNINFNEAYLDYSLSDMNVLIGNNIIFWGKNEFFNPVDVINSKDFSSGLAIGKKIGQPMINLKKYLSSSELDFYILPSQSNIYPKSDIRSQQSLNISSSNLYSKGADNNNIGIALRWSGYLNEYDYGLSYYKGNTKDPAFNVVSNTLVPNYSEITQIGLDLQATKGDYLFKGEIISRSNQYNANGLIEEYHGSILGIEHSLYGVFEKNWDLANIIEYSSDSRGSKSHHGFQNDLFYGARLVLNDIEDTQYFLSIQSDLEKNSRALTFNYESRFLSQIRGGIDIYLPLNLEEDIHQSSFKDENNIKVYSSYSF